MNKQKDTINNTGNEGMNKQKDSIDNSGNQGMDEQKESITNIGNEGVDEQKGSIKQLIDDIKSILTSQALLLQLTDIESQKTLLLISLSAIVLNDKVPTVKNRVLNSILTGNEFYLFILVPCFFSIISWLSDLLAFFAQYKSFWWLRKFINSGLVNFFTYSFEKNPPIKELSERLYEMKIEMKIVTQTIKKNTLSLAQVKKICYRFQIKSIDFFCVFPAKSVGNLTQYIILLKANNPFLIKYNLRDKAITNFESETVDFSFEKFFETEEDFSSRLEELRKMSKSWNKKVYERDLAKESNINNQAKSWSILASRLALKPQDRIFEWVIKILFGKFIK